MSIIETIRKRVSCRTYGKTAIEPDKTAKLTDYLKSNTVGPFGGKIRFDLINFDNMDRRELKPLGTYGVIKGARQFITGAVANEPKAMENYGYCMEKNILTATAMGLGTCWLGGTFNRTGFAEKMKLAEDELLPAVTPIGYAGDGRSLTERFLRFSVGSDHRKPWGELFFERGLETHLDKESTGGYTIPLECVRLGPSASNKQPWRVMKDHDNFHFYIKRTPGYDLAFGAIRIQNLDMGIAMCHFELSSREMGLRGFWRVEDQQIKSADMQYLVSWIGQND
ncbi:MAG: nitroreductase family protein [Syntrophales bacterium]|nr:nitroreductase family protein [Syntrophales bacterium]